MKRRSFLGVVIGGACMGLAAVLSLAQPKPATRGLAVWNHRRQEWEILREDVHVVFRRNNCHYLPDRRLVTASMGSSLCEPITQPGVVVAQE